MNTELITASFIIGVLAASIRLATPLLLAALGEIFTERAGILNLGVEGIMLMGALSGFLGAYWTSSLWLGVVAGMVTGLLFGLLMGFMSITAKSNQVVAGLGITILGSGLSTLLFRLTFGLRSTPPSLEIFPTLSIPLLSKIPWLGPILFEHNILVYLALLLVPISSLILYRTRLGLAIRAVGENPDAVDTRGLNVSQIRYLSVMLGGALAGLGGSYLVLGSLGLFWTQMTAGRGFIAIAVVVFSKWDPARALLGALVFGLASALQISLQTLSVPIASELLLMLPYIITILVLVSVSRRAEFPSAFAVPYYRGGKK
ncbi:MAG: branched-chain amino acid ABC transporter permease [Chloroflexi bacterium]|nr:MAG: branched-chain amino acid ABC transporter permease [Chloroflexota bacterium]PIE80739.1 MAG: branched-chain amino acid ABC transporter permease [Chloroflexota bacterium]